MAGRIDWPIAKRNAGPLLAGLLLVLVQTNGCSSAKSPSEQPRAEAPTAPPAEQKPAAPQSKTAEPPEPKDPAKPAEQPKPVEQPKTAEPPKAAEQPKTAEPSSAAPQQPKPAEPQAKAGEPAEPKPAAPAQPKPATPAPAKPPAPPPPKPSAATPPPAPQRAAIVDLTALEKRLRDTGAIGVFTKLSLKNEVDDLLEQFRTFHAGRGGGPLAKLRERYDLLVLKVVSLLQDKDSALARDISTSREALWSLLADPVKFKTL